MVEKGVLLMADMVKEFVDAFMDGKGRLRAKLDERLREDAFGIDYDFLVKSTFETIESSMGDRYRGKPSADLIHCIDDGSYQGTLVYVIPEAGYQPSRYWYCRIAYGSCSACDTLEGILTTYEFDDRIETALDDLMALCLHIVQGTREMEGEEVCS